jgi:DUF971 family protein
MSPSFQPRVITRSDPTRVEIEWTDGHTTVFTPAQLRGMCPCARCVDELTGRRLHDPASVPPDLRQSNLTMVGNYAIAMQFSDGHQTGIYPFRMLRDNDPSPPSPPSRR